jgi:mono/diheme cytochrome c family protein
MVRFMPGVGVVLCGLAIAFGALAQSPPDAARGKQLFMNDGCYECHGTQGAGGGIAGPPLAPDVFPLEAIKIQLRRPASRMPPYSQDVLSDAQIADIYAYLKSIPAGKPASRIPLLQPGRFPESGSRSRRSGQ